jgi:hypothetical protein
MDNLAYFNPQKPRIRIIKSPETGPEIPAWFLEELIGIILPVDAYLESHRGFYGIRRYEFRVKKEKVYQALQRKSRPAADFLRDNPVFLKESFLRFNESACEFLGSWKELRCEVACTQ